MAAHGYWGPARCAARGFAAAKVLLTASMPLASRLAAYSGEVWIKWSWTRISGTTYSGIFAGGIGPRDRSAGSGGGRRGALLDEAKQGILQEYYIGCFEGMPEAVPNFVAKRLITTTGFRNSVSEDDWTAKELSLEHLKRLVDRRLLRVEERHGARRIELTHDLLTPVVREYREKLKRKEAEARRAELAQQSADAERKRLENRLQEAELRAAKMRGRRLATFVGVLVAAVCITGDAAAVALKMWKTADDERGRANVEPTVSPTRVACQSWPGL